MADVEPIDGIDAEPAGDLALPNPPRESALGDSPFTVEQLTAIESRDGDLLLDAGAGSGKTAVLVERFVRAVREDDVEVGRILAITFTEKAAAELRDRIRERLHELGDHERARATEGAWISTIHGFCARVLRASALAVGIDPAFAVLDETEAGQLAELAFEGAVESVGAVSSARSPGGEFASVESAGADSTEPDAVDLIAGYRVPRLRRAIVAVHGELRSRGELAPTLPPLRPVAPSEIEDARRSLAVAHAAAVAELAARPENGGSLADARARLERCARFLVGGVGIDAHFTDPWLADIDAARLRNGSAAALSGEACGRYRDALEAFRAAVGRREGARAHHLLDRLLREYGARYAELKRERSALDFEDLELLTRDLFAGNRELRGRYRQRFAQIMVDELQDTNPVQLELIESIADENLFTVGDAFQSIYGFRHADVELFEQRRERLSALGARATLSANFRSRRELLDALNAAFAPTFGERFTPLTPGRTDAPSDPGVGPVVELIVVDKDADWGPSAGDLSAAWRVAEARALAARVHELLSEGAAPRDVVLLARATTDLRAYERALEERAVPTYVIGGRGYWSHPQVIDLVAYLRALANPCDGQALYTVLASPLVAASSDALVVLAAVARESKRDAWSVLREPGLLLEDLELEDRRRLEAFAGWFSGERERAARASIEELIERGLEFTGYDLAMLAMPGGERRLANVRKLMRLGREHESRHGHDVRGFLDLVSGLASGRLSEPRESEAPVEGEALDAVRLMTIHRAKGLEFEIVCVADLGRTPRGSGGDVLRVGRDGALGLKVARVGRGRLMPVLDYDTVGVAREEAEEREERRLYYVAMTRARERLVLSGAITCERWPDRRRGNPPLAWIAPAFVPDIAARAAADNLTGVVERAEGEWRARVAYSIVRPEPEGPAAGAATDPAPAPPPARTAPPALPPAAAHPPATPAAPASLSYSSLGEYARCGYRFYLERVLGLPGVESSRRREGGESGISALDRGVLVHAMLETLDFRRGRAPSPEEAMAAAERMGLRPKAAELEEGVAMVERFLGGEIAMRLAAAAELRREEPFAFVLEPHGVVVTGFLDAVAREGAKMIVVDYKSDRLAAEDPAGVVAREYQVQRLVYALAALKGGAEEVEVVHTFLEAPERPVSATYVRSGAEALEREVAALATGVLSGEFTVSPAPHQALCHGCPGEGGLCSWPLELTRRERIDTLF
ncbi:MAG TPA: UvrD-helicase domain-containing protein [Solirubrobacteraceae bacterium]|nr:UvrD-helicase domain-containing protein [Solirubrobacteraceae bacterium]